MYIDEWKISWQLDKNGIFYPKDGPIKTHLDLKTYSLPDADSDYLYKSLKKAIKKYKGWKAIVFITHETFEYSHYIFGGMDKLFLNYVLDPDLVKELTEIIWSYKKKVIANAIEIGADAVAFGIDDLLW